MNKSGWSSSKDIDLQISRIELSFKEEIEENNIYLAASVAYFFGMVYASLTGEVETYFGVILVLTAVMIVWAFRDMRKAIRRKYEQQIEELLQSIEA